MSNPMKVDELTKLYVETRDAVRALETEYDEKKKPYKEKLDKIEGVLLAILEKTGSEAIRTEYGTVHTTTRSTASIVDGSIFKAFILDMKLYDLVDWRANAPAIKAYTQGSGSLPPGVNFSTITRVGVRRA